MTELECAAAHLYPGARLRLGSGADGPAVIRFGDGASASAELWGDRLSVAAYTTGAGTAITAKAWQLERDGPELRVTQKA